MPVASAAGPPPTLPCPALPGVPPRDPQARRDFLSDAVMKAVGRAVRLLDDDDSKVALAAVQEILAVEKTRMRHAGTILGAHPAYIDDMRKELGEPGDLSVGELYSLPAPRSTAGEPTPALARTEPPTTPDFTRDPDYPGGPVLSRDPAKIGPPGSAVPPWERQVDADANVRTQEEEEDEKPNRQGHFSFEVGEGWRFG